MPEGRIAHLGSTPVSLAFDPPDALVEKMLRINFVIMDVDGTVTSAVDKTALNVSQVLGRLERAGIKWSFATGRSIAGLFSTVTDVVSRSTKHIMPPAICYNGAVVFMAGEPTVLKIRTIPEADVQRILSLATDLQLRALAYSCRNDLGSPKECVYTTDAANSRSGVDINGMPLTFLDDWSSLDLSSIVAILFETQREGDISKSDFIQQRLGPSLRVTSSGGQFYEIATAGTTKGHALVEMLLNLESQSKRYPGWSRFAGLNLETTMAIGDNLNDVDMLERVGLGVAVANSPGAVKSVADMICSLPAGRGAVEAIRVLLDVRRYRGHSAI